MNERLTFGPLLAIHSAPNLYDVVLAVSPTTLVGQVLIEDGMYSAMTHTPAGMLGDANPHVELLDAVADIERRHLTARRVARAVRAIRPATGAGVAGEQAVWDGGYNQALRDVEAVLRDLVGPAAQTEGYTAITGGRCGVVLAELAEALAAEDADDAAAAKRAQRAAREEQ